MNSLRLTKLLTINSTPVVALVKDSTNLGLFKTGRATFNVVCDEEPKGIVELHIGYSVDNMIPYFVGVIESKHQHNKQWFITCRELIGALSFPFSVAIRFATIKKVLDKLSETGIEFIVPDNADYLSKTVPCFYHNGSGITALQQLSTVFNINHFIFQQRNDGKIYVGSWDDSNWATSEINNFAEHPLNVTSSTKAELVAIPKLRPGIKLNGRYITEVTLTGNKQSITWSKRLSLNA